MRCEAMRCTTELNLAHYICSSHILHPREYDSLGESEMERSARGQKQLLAPLAALISSRSPGKKRSVGWLRQACETTRWQGSQSVTFAQC